jgi:hypothetical protein
VKALPLEKIRPARIVRHDSHFLFHNAGDLFLVRFHGFLSISCANGARGFSKLVV